MDWMKDVVSLQLARKDRGPGNSPRYTEYRIIGYDSVGNSCDLSVRGDNPAEMRRHAKDLANKIRTEGKHDCVVHPHYKTEQIGLSEVDRAHADNFFRRRRTHFKILKSSRHFAAV